MEYPDLKEIERRPKQYWNADGLPDLLFGFVWIIWGIGFLLPDLLAAGKWRSYFSWLSLAIMVVSGYVANWAIKKLKQRLTFPRAGYVEWRKPGIGARVAVMILAAAVAAGTALLASHGKGWGIAEYAPPALALFFALGYLIASIWHKLPHLLYSSALSLVLAGIFARTRIELHQAWIAFLLCLGVLSCLVGFIRLRIFIHRNHQQQESEV
jgi:hypothetical protein